MLAVGSQEILNGWVDSVNKKNVDGVTNLYDSDASLWATFSPDAFYSRSQIKVYFQDLISSSNPQVTLNTATVNAQRISGDCYVLTGQYIFQTQIDNAKAVYPSRFTFVVDVSREHPILHHHSSQIPQKHP